MQRRSHLANHANERGVGIEGENPRRSVICYQKSTFRSPSQHQTISITCCNDVKTVRKKVSPATEPIPVPLHWLEKWSHQMEPSIACIDLLGSATHE